MITLWDKICILNLKKDKSRLISTINQLKKYNLNGHKCINGINGYNFVPYGHKIKSKKNIKLISKMRSKLSQNKIIKKTKYRNLRIGEIGCNLSHMETMKIALKNRYNKILILEDDIKIHPKFINNLQKIKPFIPTDCDILFLGINNINYKWGSFKKINKYINKPFGSKTYTKYPESDGGIYGAHAYIINRKAMKEFIKHTQPMTYPADVTLGKLSTKYKTINAYSLNTNLISTFRKGSNTLNIK